MPFSYKLLMRTSVYRFYKRKDLSQAGVYFLFCHDDDGSDSVYIGEAENVKDRLMQHLHDSQAEKEKYYWNTAVVFTGRDLTKAHIRYLENRFVEIAKECKRYLVLTKSTYHNTVMKESQVAVMEEFIDIVKLLINVLGYKVLEPFVQSGTGNEYEDEQLYLSTGGVNAAGRVTSEGFVLLKGASVNEKTSYKCELYDQGQANFIMLSYGEKLIGESTITYSTVKNNRLIELTTKYADTEDSNEMEELARGIVDSLCFGQEAAPIQTTPTTTEKSGLAFVYTDPTEKEPSADQLSYGALSTTRY